MNRHAWLQKHPSPLTSAGEFHWYPEVPAAGDRELRASFVERVRGVEPPAVLWQLERGRVAWAQVFSATAPLDGRRYVGLVLSVVEASRPTADLLAMLAPPPAGPWSAAIATESAVRALAVQELATLRREARGDIAGVARALLSGGVARVDDPESPRLPAWIASIERILPEPGSRPRTGVWCTGRASGASKVSMANGASEANGASGASRASDADASRAGDASRASGPSDSSRASSASRASGPSDSSRASSASPASGPSEASGPSGGSRASDASRAGGAGRAGEPSGAIDASRSSSPSDSSRASDASLASEVSGLSCTGRASDATEQSRASGVGAGGIGATGGAGASFARGRAASGGASDGTTGPCDRVAELAAAAWRDPSSRQGRAWTLLCELAAARGESIDQVGAALEAIDAGVALTPEERVLAGAGGVVEVLHAWGRGRLDRSPAADTLAARLADLVALRVLARLAAGDDAGAAIAEARWYALVPAMRRNALLAAVARRTASLRALVEAIPAPLSEVHDA